MLYNLLRAFRVTKNKLRYKFSPDAIKADIQMIVNDCVLEHPSMLVKALDDFEGVVDYNYDAKGNFHAVLASGAEIKVTTEITGVE